MDESSGKHIHGKNRKKYNQFLEGIVEEGSWAHTVNFLPSVCAAVGRRWETQ